MKNKLHIGVLIIFSLVILVAMIWAAFRKVEKRTNEVVGDKKIEETWQTSEPVKIGVITMLTGRAAAIGDKIKKGLEMAYDEIDINRDKIELIFEDDSLEPKKSLSAYSFLVNAKDVKIIIGATGGACVLTVAPQAQQDKILYITPTAAANKISDVGDYVFRNDVPSRDKYIFLAEYMIKRYSTIATIYDVSEDVGVEGENLFVEKYEGLGGRVLARESFSKNDSDFKTQIASIKSTNPEAILFYALAPQSTQLIKQLRELGMDGPFFTDTPVGTDADFLKFDSSNGVFFVSQLFNRDTDPVFWDRYLAKFGTTPIVYAAESYEVLYVLDHCLKSCNYLIDNDCVRSCLNNLNGYPGVTGPISFDEKGDAVGKSLVIMQIKDGQFMPYEEK